VGRVVPVDGTWLPRQLLSRQGVCLVDHHEDERDAVSMSAAADRFDAARFDRQVSVSLGDDTSGSSQP
jgi:hypothetical protein